tara:strand:- start:282 stop:797 length:516 start_codon:yes stop_codon:yes gene_type:complete
MAQDPNNYWEQLERLEKLIRASEFKAGAVFSFHSLILGIFIDRLDQLAPIFLESYLFIALSIMWMLSVLISIFHCFLCFKPQIEMKYSKNVFFFRDAVNAFGSIEEYSKRLMEICDSETALYVQLSEQIHAECKIIDQKFKSVHSAIKFFGLSFIIVILTIVVWLIKLYLH